MKNKGFRFLSVFFVCLFVSSVLLIKPVHVLFDPHCDHTCESNKNETKTHDCTICHFHFDTFSFQNTDGLGEIIYVCLGKINVEFGSDPITKTLTTVHLRAPPSVFLSYITYIYISITPKCQT